MSFVLHLLALQLPQLFIVASQLAVQVVDCFSELLVIGDGLFESVAHGVFNADHFCLLAVHLALQFVQLLGGELCAFEFFLRASSQYRLLSESGTLLIELLPQTVYFFIEDVCVVHHAHFPVLGVAFKLPQLLHLQDEVVVQPSKLHIALIKLAFGLEKLVEGLAVDRFY